MTGNTEDTALGKESALSMINQGADVIMHAADTTGLGVIEACVEKGASTAWATAPTSMISPPS